MIKLLSPYYINIPFKSPLTDLVCSKFRLELYIWEGLKSDIPSEPSYEITKSNPEALETTTKINIANLISPFLDFEPVNLNTLGTEIVNGGNQIWYKTSVYYSTTNLLEVNTPQLEETKIALKGYSYGMDGENAETPTNKVLMQGREFKVGNDTKFIIPLEIEETEVAEPVLNILSITNVGGDDYDIEYEAVGNFGDVILYYYDADDIQPQIYFISDIGSSIATVTLELPTGTGSVNFYLSSFEADLGIGITSTIFNKII